MTLDVLLQAMTVPGLRRVAGGIGLSAMGVRRELVSRVLPGLSVASVSELAEAFDALTASMLRGLCRKLGLACGRLKADRVVALLEALDVAQSSRGGASPWGASECVDVVDLLGSLPSARLRRIASEFGLGRGGSANELRERIGIFLNPPIEEELAWLLILLTEKELRAICADFELVTAGNQEVLIFRLINALPTRTLSSSVSRENSEQSESDEGPWASAPLGTVINGRWKVGERLGRGGFGEVFRVTDLMNPGRRLVIKLSIGVDDTIPREIGIAWLVPHQNVASYYDRGEDGDEDPPRPFLIMEYGGLSVEALLESEGELGFDRAVHIVAQAAEALDFAHRGRRERVVHGDINPGNVLVDVEDNDFVRVTDFGLSQAAEATPDGRSVVAIRPLGFHYGYSAPEVLRAGGDEVKLHRADQYSLALVLVSLLTGELFSSPFEPRSLGVLSDPQNTALFRALDPDPDARFDCCRDFLKALLEIAPSSGSARARRPRHKPRSSKRRRARNSGSLFE
jgi:hypothetical protein